jgi:hypothetical protein
VEYFLIGFFDDHRLRAPQRNPAAMLRLPHEHRESNKGVPGSIDQGRWQ